MSTECAGFPLVRQKHTWDCGVAVAQAMFMWARGTQETPRFLLDFADETGFLGGVEAMKELLSILGPTTTEWTLSRFPVVVLIREPDSNDEHWVVVTGRTDRSITLMDPDEGWRIVPLQEFHGWWENPALSSRLLGLYCDPS